MGKFALFPAGIIRAGAMTEPGQQPRGEVSKAGREDGTILRFFDQGEVTCG